MLSAITGVAGSGKSSLLACLPEDVAKRMLFMDQTPIKGSRRSNPATYTGALDAIRRAFAKVNSTPDNTVKPALFSANSEGACPNCNGTGVIYVEFGFMGCVDVPCEVCEGRSLIRFPAESVSVSSSPREFVAQKEPLTSRYLAEYVA
ncbi:UvrABC system protein A [Corynebacterium striatum]|nr:UvrABC system protein A [Corynebacterium striatum]